MDFSWNLDDMATLTSQDDQRANLEPASLVGRDEMNLAEFPITLLADFAPKGQKTLCFEGGNGRLTVTGSDAYGLPTALDADVIVALIYLTKLRNDFQDMKVNFSRYELIKLLNWPDKGSSYNRLDQALNRWVGVLLIYDKCWWNNKTKRYVSAKMHILESVVITEPGKTRDGQSDLPLSTFTWNKTFIESCQADNLRQLDLDEYFSLKSAVSKRLYRFLGKRFYLQGEWTFDLNEIAFDRVGLSRSYEGNAGKIKEKLQPAIDELERIGFLKPLSRSDRYTRIDRGHWSIRLTRQSPTLAAPQQAAPAVVEPEAPLVAELVSRGVTRTTAADLVRQYPADAIEAKIEVFDWLAEKRDKRVSKNPGGYLAESIRKGYVPPKGFESKMAREKKQADERERKRRAEETQRRAEAEERVRAEAEQLRVDAYLASLTPEERDALQAEALAKANPFFARQYRRSQGDAKSEARYLKLIVEAHVSEILADRESAH
jgi:Replication initiator protein A